MDDLFKAVRQGCSPATWSKAVELVRREAVTGDRMSDDEIVLRVQNLDTGISPTVTLWPGDEDWQCDCAEKLDPCAHVAAAVIALRRAEERGEELPRSKVAAGRLVYEFRSTADGLAFERIITFADTGERRVLFKPLSSLIAEGERADVTATKDDMAVEVALGHERRGLLPAPVMRRVIQALAVTELSVELDGGQVKLQNETLGLRAVAVDEGPSSVRLRAEQDPRIRIAFANGACLTDAGLHPLAERPRLEPRDHRALAESRIFGPQELAELQAEILPRIEAVMPVLVKTDRLPRREVLKPRLELVVEARGETLIVDPRIAYGDPTLAFVTADGRLEATAGGAVPERDRAAELALSDQLSREMSLEIGRRQSLAVDAAMALIDRARARSLAMTGSGEQAFRRFPELKPRVALEGMKLSAEFLATAGGKDERHADPGRVLNAWQAGERFVPLIGGGYAPLPSDWLSRYGKELQLLLSARQADGELKRGSLPAAADFLAELGATPPPALANLRDKLAAVPPLGAAALPPDLHADLRPYQRAGVAWLAYLKSLGFGGILADDMGLGKTLQTIAVLEGPALVVAPLSVLTNWQREIARFRPSLGVAIYHGSERRLDPEADVTLTTYAVLRLDQATLEAQRWRMAVLDEAQNIKNPQSQVSLAAFALRADCKVALTGTPIENRLDDLWSQVEFTNPGLLGTRASFQEAYGRGVVAGDPTATARLRARVKPFIMRRLKRDVARDLPPRTDMVLRAELSPDERRLYDAIMAATRADVVSRLEAGGSVIEALEALLRLRQAACHPALVPGGTGEDSAKVSLLVDSLTEAVAEGHKALVFSQWTGLLDLIEPALTRAGLGYLRLDGATRDRAAVVDRFQSPDGPPVLIMSLKAGGTGLNLTEADHVFILDPWWNPAAEDQAADRAHRIGQERPVIVSRLVAIDTVEERILELQAAKRALADAVVGDGTGAGLTLTRDDLLALLS